MKQQLVLVHGTRFDAAQWRGYDELLPEVDITAVDLPGHGTRGADDWHAGDAVAVVAEAVEATRDPRVVLAGHSLGGYVATTYAERHPESLGALVLIGATADPRRHPVLRHAYTGFARALRVVGADRMAAGTNRILAALGAGTDDIPGPGGYAALPAAWASTMATAGPRQLEDVACPVYLVGGQFDQLRIDARHYAAACREPHERVIAGATHFAPVTHREQIAAVLRDALAAASARDAGDGPGQR